MKRNTPLVTGEIYHVYTKSIYRYIIFPTEREYERMMRTLRYHQRRQTTRLSDFLDSYAVRTMGFDRALDSLPPTGSGGGLVNILAYCLMPTHLHLILRQVQDEGIRLFMQRALNSYSQFFNKLHNRHGPLWQSRFGASLIRTDEKLAEKIAYVHNNPVKDLGYPSPGAWKYSSYNLPPTGLGGG